MPPRKSIEEMVREMEDGIERTRRGEHVNGHFSDPLASEERCLNPTPFTREMRRLVWGETDTTSPGKDE